MNAHPESHVTVLVPASGDLHLLQAVLGQLRTGEVKVVVADDNDEAPAMPEFNSSQEPTAGALRFSPIPGL